MDDRSLVGADRVSISFERGVEMVDGGLARATIEGTGFEEDVSIGGFEPFADIFGRGPGWRFGKLTREQRSRIEAILICNPTDAARGKAGEFPFDSIVVAKGRFLRAQKANEFLTDVAETD
jgi:hypothetical protein